MSANFPPRDKGLERDYSRYHTRAYEKMEFEIVPLNSLTKKVTKKKPKRRKPKKKVLKVPTRLESVE